MSSGKSSEKRSRRSGRAGKKRQTGWAISLSLAALVVFASPVQAANRFVEVASQSFDLVVVRPLLVGRLMMGALFFIPAAVFAEAPPVMGGDEDRWIRAEKDVFEIFLGEPFEAAFRTPLGEFPE